MDNSNNTNSNSSQASNAWQEYLDKHYKNNNKGETIKDIKQPVLDWLDERRIDYEIDEYNNIVDIEDSKALEEYYSTITKKTNNSNVELSGNPQKGITNKSQQKKHTHPFIIILLLILIIAFVVNTFEIYDLKQQLDDLKEWIDGIDNRTSKEINLNSQNQASSSWKEFKKQQEDRERQENLNQELETMVWVGDTGTKYHKHSCRTLKGNGHQTTMEQALSEGRQPCKVCY